jgi:glycosyltransferase involved in cell wall biosynthesis
VVAGLRSRGVNVQLSLIGKGADAYVAMCKEHATLCNVENYVNFMGSRKQDELEKEYKEHDIFILGTKFEIFGMVLLEALYFGRIVIASAAGGTETILKNEKNGFLMNDFDVNAWVDQIIKICHREYDLDAIMRNARASVLTHFSWDESADIFIDAYKSYLAK